MFARFAVHLGSAEESARRVPDRRARWRLPAGQEVFPRLCGNSSTPGSGSAIHLGIPGASRRSAAGMLIAFSRGMTPTIRKILLPIDFSVPSQRAAGYAAVLARSLGASVHLVHALDKPSI